VQQISGPLLIKGLTLPSNTSPIVSEIQSYFDKGKSAPALEFISPIKGPNLPQICVEVGSGMKTALQGAQDYDKDVKKQAQQLGIEGW
jgi:raffinose/stachyose/melibiose transport system substrate-binding protein